MIKVFVSGYVYNLKRTPTKSYSFSIMVKQKNFKTNKYENVFISAISNSKLMDYVEERDYITGSGTLTIKKTPTATYYNLYLSEIDKPYKPKKITEEHESEQDMTERNTNLAKKEPYIKQASIPLSNEEIMIDENDLPF